MNNSIHNSYLLIEKNKIRENVYSVLDQLSPGTQLIPVLKCNAYGLGLEAMAEILQDIPAIHTIAVAQIIEAIALRKVNQKQDILVLGATTDESQFQVALEQNFILTAYRVGFVADLARTARKYGKKARVHIKINTGLNRLGVCVGDELAQMIREILEHLDAIEVTGAFSHFSELVSSQKTVFSEEVQRFLQAVQQLQESGVAISMRHICASAAWETHPEFSLDAVRLGRRLYYDHPLFPKRNVQEAVSWRARIVDIHWRKAGEKIGYSEGVCLKEDARIALLGVGYGDGLNLKLVQVQAPVLIRGKRAHIIGCCMDQCFIHLQDIDCSIGDEATLFGYDETGNLLSGQEIAGLIQEEACTLTTALGPRVLRVYR